jgi:23S rRNA (guanosine2251-2'-O)-methyltransferase
VTPHVARSSAGAVNYLDLFRVDELADLLQSLKDVGVLIVAATEKASTPLWQAGLGVAVAIVVGSEAAGIRPELLEICDCHVSIPMLGQVTSLNAAVAAGVLMYEVRRQHHALIAGGPGP